MPTIGADAQRNMTFKELRGLRASPGGIFMDFSEVGWYWLDYAGGAPPAKLRALRVADALPAPGAAPTASAVFLIAPPADIARTCAEIRKSLGAEAYIVVIAAKASAKTAALIGRGVDEVTTPEALAEPSVLLARTAAHAAERARSAEALAALERRCSQIQAGLDALPTPIFFKDADVRYIGCNKAFERFIGLRLDAIIGKGVHDIAPPELAKRYEEADRGLLATGDEQIYEASVRYADGSNHEVMFHKALFRDSDGATAGIAGVMLDISRRKRTEAALHESEQRYRDVFEHASDSIALIDVTPDGRFALATANPAARRACGLPDDGGANQPVELTLSPNAAAPFLERLAECIAARATTRYETAFKGPFGIRTFVVNLVPVMDADKAVRRIIAIARDVTDEREVERIRGKRELDFRTLVDNSPDAIVRYDRTCRRLYSNRSIERTQHVDPEVVLGKTPVEARVLGDAEQERLYQDWLLAVMTKGAPDEKQFVYVTRSGQRRIATVRAIPERGPNGDVVSVLSIGTDTHERTRAEQQLRQREQDFRTLVENSPDIIGRYDADCRRLYVNPVAQKFFGAKRVALGGAPSPHTIVNFDEYMVLLRNVLTSGREGELECGFIAEDGSTRQTHVRIVPEFDENDKVIGALGIGRDITEIVESRRKIQHLAFYDSLTGLPNRSLLSERIAEIALRPEKRGAFALMLLDLDHFKEVNDTFGHAVGDALLCKVAARLRRCLRRTDTISRLGGDEFAILLPNVTGNRDFAAIADKILRALVRPFHLSGREIVIFASLGVAESGGARLDIDTLFKHADSAMYHAKRMGRNNFQFFTPEMMARNVWRMAVETNLRKAISRGELDVYFQPRVALRTRKILGAEALLRWRHDELGFLTPDKFISVAEESGQIVEIGRWVLSEACRRAVDWNNAGSGLTQVSVNLSSREFVMNDLVGSLKETLDASGCDPRWLELEITESLLLEDNKTIRAMLQRIREMGVAVAVDDFGTGFSALSYLTRFPISTLKIDRSFVSDIERDRKRAELVKAIVGISKALELKLVAEGVETEAQAEFLLHAGCHEAQGFLFGRPMPEAEFNAYFRASLAGLTRPAISA
jgi:diguanylate cyclase (GGDEF)-like protein/PAS domain S-box-containing protein